MLIREGLKAVLARSSHFVVCGETSVGATVAEQVRTLNPQILVLDLVLPDVDGLDLLSALCREFPSLPVLVFSGQDDRHYSERVLSLGAMGYLPKSGLADQLIAALTHIESGKRYFTATQKAGLLDRVGLHSDALRDPWDRLSNRELELFRLLGQGLSSRGIAQRWCRSVKTIESHRENLKKKLGLANGNDLIHAAVVWTQQRSQGPAHEPRERR